MNTTRYFPEIVDFGNILRRLEERAEDEAVNLDNATVNAVIDDDEDEVEESQQPIIDDALNSAGSAH